MSDVAVVGFTVGDAPDAWGRAGFAVVGDAVRLGGVVVRCVGDDAARGIRSWTLTGVEPGAIDGLPTEAAGPDEGADEPPRHPNGVVGVDHVVVMTPDCDRTAAAFARRGLAVRRDATVDTYGPPVRQLFLRAGEVIVEVVGPRAPAGDDPTAFFGLALTTSDLEGAARLLGDALGRIEDAVQPGRRIATVRHRALGLSVPLALMTPEP